MTARTTRVAAIALCVAAAFCSCQRKKPPAPVMVPPVNVQTTAQPPPPPPPPPDIPPAQNGTAVPPPPATTEKMPGPPRRKPKKTKQTHKDSSATTSTDAPQAATTTPTPAAPDTANAPVPQLGQMLTDAQRRDYETHIHDALERARGNLGKARGNGRLSEAQQHMAAQVETFVAQAEERRKTDLVSARSLAERADLLARDLAESLH